MFLSTLLLLLTLRLDSGCSGPIEHQDEPEEPRRLLEELFLGGLIYPQDRGELQVTTSTALGGACFQLRFPALN